MGKTPHGGGEACARILPDMNSMNALAGRVKIGLAVTALATLTGCVGWVGGDVGYVGGGGWVDDGGWWGGGRVYDRGHDVRGYSARGAASRGIAHGGGGGRHAGAGGNRR